MPRRPLPPPPDLEPEAGREILLECRERGKTLLEKRPISEVAFDTWKTSTEAYVERAFGMASDHASTFVAHHRRFVPPASDDPDPDEVQQGLIIALNYHLEVLDALIDDLDLKSRWTSKMQPTAIHDVATGFDSKRVFLVHGRNHGLRETVARFVERVGLVPVILEELANEGLTVIEKFEKHAGVSFAIVLLTADDRGGLKSTDPSDYKPRARQNVIFELGYFVGKLTRKHVLCMLEPSIEKPTDYDGVLFVALDEGGAWKLSLIRELKAGGMEVNMNEAV